MKQPNANGEKTKQSATILILKALIPYTAQNLKLTYNPTEFFDELERTSDFSRRTLVQTFARAKKQRLIDDEGVPSLTAKGRRQVQPFVARQLQGGGQLMVIFDIPVDFYTQRRQFRTLLKYLGFSQIQRSVWVSPNDHLQVVKEAVVELRLGDWVQMYDASRIH